MQNKNKQKRKQLIQLNPRKRKETIKIIKIIKKSSKKSSQIKISGIRVLIKRRRKRMKKKIRKGIHISLYVGNHVQGLALPEKKKLRKIKMHMDIIHMLNQL